MTRIESTHIISLLTAGLVFLAGQQLFSQADPDEGPVFQLDPFEVVQEETSYVPTSSVVASGFAIENIKNPIKISSLTDRFIDDLKIDKLQYALNYMPSITPSTVQDGSLHGTPVRIRGFSTSWANRNGIRRYIITGTDNISRLEAVKGPAAVFFGEANPGGVFNYVTKRPSFIPENSFELRYGSYNYKRAEVSSQGALFNSEKFAYRINASYLDTEDWRDWEWQERTFLYGGILIQPVESLKIYVEAEKVDDENNDAVSVPMGNPDHYRDYLALAEPGNPVVSYYTANPGEISMPVGSTEEQVRNRLQGRWRAASRPSDSGIRRWREDTANALGIDIEELSPYHRVMPEATPFGYRWNALNEAGFVSHDLENFTIETTWSPTDWVTFRGAYVLDDAYRLFLLTTGQAKEFNMTPEGPAFIGQRLDPGGLANETVTIIGNAVFRFETGFADHTLLIGIDDFKDDFFGINHDATITSEFANQLGRWNYGTNGYTDQVYSDPTFESVLRVSNHRRSYYFNYIARLWGDRIVVAGGVRRENAAQYSGGDKNNPALEQKEDTPSIGTVIEMFPGINFFASYSNSFNPYGATLATINQSIGLSFEERERLRQDLGSDVLQQPKLGKGFDVGFKTSLFDGKANLTFSYYSIEESNRTNIFDPELTLAEPLNADYLAQNPGTVAEDLPVQRYRLLGVSRVRGLEVEGIIQPVSNWSILISYSHFIKASQEQNDTSLPELPITGSPNQRVSVWNRYDFKEGRFDGLAAGLGMVYSDGWLTRADSNYLFETVSYFTIDAMVEYAFTWKEKTDVKLSLNVRNLNDEVYYGEGGYGSPSDPLKVIFSTSVSF